MGVPRCVVCCLAPTPMPWLCACGACCPSLQHPAAVVAWHLVLRHSCVRQRGSLGCLFDAGPCAALVGTSRSQCNGRLYRRCGAFPYRQASASGLTVRLGAARGGRSRTGLMVPAPGPCRGRVPGLAPRHTRLGPRDGVLPGGSLRRQSWAACAAAFWRVGTRSLRRLVSCLVRRSMGDYGGAPWLFFVDADTFPFGSEDTTPGCRACVCVLALLGRVGQAGLPGAF